MSMCPLTRCNPCDTHCMSVVTNVWGRLGGTLVFTRPYAQVRKWSPKHRTSSYIRFRCWQAWTMLCYQLYEQCCVANCEQCCTSNCEQCCTANCEQCCNANCEQCFAANYEQSCSTVNFKNVVLRLCIRFTVQILILTLILTIILILTIVCIILTKKITLDTDSWWFNTCKHSYRLLSMYQKRSPYILCSFWRVVWVDFVVILW